MSHSSGEAGKGFPLSPVLRHALTSADAKHRASLDVLRTAICEYVEDLQHQGRHAGDVATAIRRRIADLRSADEAAGGGGKVDGLVDDMIASCLESAR